MVLEEKETQPVVADLRLRTGLGSRGDKEEKMNVGLSLKHRVAYKCKIPRAQASRNAHLQGRQQC
jgi:hypothetical protein